MSSSALPFQVKLSSNSVATQSILQIIISITTAIKYNLKQIKTWEVLETKHLGIAIR